MRSYLLAFFFVGLLLVPLALAHPDHGDATVTEQRVKAEGEVRPGRIVELDFETHAGESISYTIKADALVSWDIHEHGDGGVTTHANGSATRSESGTFKAPHDGRFSLMVVAHDEATANVALTLEGTFALVGSSGVSNVSAASSPGPAAIMALAAVGLGLWVTRCHRSR